jgi:hypothetical protein
MLIHPVLVPCLVALLLLAASIVPRVKCGLPVYPDPSSVNPIPCNGVLHFGWPKTARVDEIIQRSNFTSYFHPRYSLNHLLGTEEFYVQKTRQSVLAHVSNAAAIFSSVLLSALGVHAFSKRSFSLKSLFAVVTLVGILTATFSWGHSL